MSSPTLSDTARPWRHKSNFIPRTWDFFDVRGPVALLMIAGWLGVWIVALPSYGSSAFSIALPGFLLLLLILVGVRVQTSSFRNALPAYALLGSVYFGYCVRPAIVAISGYSVPLTSFPVTETPDAVRDAAWIGLMAGGALVVAVVFGLSRSKTPQAQRDKSPRTRRQYNSLAIFISAAVLIIGVGTDLLLASLDIGVAGGEPASLPFRLGGILVALRGFFVLLGLLGVLAGYRSGSRSVLFAVFGVLLLHTAVLAITTASRGVIPVVFISALLIILFESEPPNLTKYVLSIALVVSIVIFLWNPITARRQGSAAPESEGTTLERAIGSIGNGSKSLVDRATGFETLIPLVNFDGASLGPGESISFIKSHPSGLSEYYTRTVLGFLPEARTGFTPSTPGWFFIFGGPAAVIVGMLFIGVFILWLWRLVVNSNWLTSPLLLATLTWMAWNWPREWDPDIFFRKDAWILLAQLVVLELVTRLFRDGSRQKSYWRKW